MAEGFSPAGGQSLGQLVFDLPHRPAMGREDFVVGACNEEAVAVIDRWPDWPQHRYAIVGPTGSGKSHLASVWQRTTGAALVKASELTSDLVPGFAAAPCVVVEDGETVRDEAAFFHFLNAAAEHGVSLLITAASPAAHWPLADAGLVSRLTAVPCVMLAAPSDDVLRHVLAKLFRDRQLDVPDDLPAYLVARMPRSFAAARRVVDELDRRSLQEGRPIGKRLAAEILAFSID